MEAWIEKISADTPTFDDPIAGHATLAREHIITHLRLQIRQVIAIVEREHTKHERAKKSSTSNPASSTAFSAEGIIAALETTYQGPGDLREDGPRHDNDFVDIAQIRIAPTHQELVSPISNFLPANIYGSPNPHPIGSMQRHLDIQYRLLREELMYGFVIVMILRC